LDYNKSGKKALSGGLSKTQINLRNKAGEEVKEEVG